MTSNIFTLAWWDETFTNPVTRDPYPVPQALRNAATEICFRAHITGSCDPMYVANIIARESGWGDGQGNFTGSPHLTDEVIDRIALRFVGSDRFLGAYATCCHQTATTISDIAAILGSMRDNINSSEVAR